MVALELVMMTMMTMEGIKENRKRKKHKLKEDCSTTQVAVSPTLSSVKVLLSSGRKSPKSPPVEFVPPVSLVYP